MIRAFVAIAMPEDVVNRLRLLQFLLPLPRRVEPEDFHLTLAFLGEQPDHRLEAVHDGLERLAFPPFALELRGLGLFGGAKPRLAFAAVPELPDLIRLQAKIARIAVAAGIAVPSRDFHPHVTLGRFAPPRRIRRSGWNVAWPQNRAFTPGHGRWQRSGFTPLIRNRMARNTI